MDNAIHCGMTFSQEKRFQSTDRSNAGLVNIPELRISDAATAFRGVSAGDYPPVSCRDLCFHAQTEDVANPPALLYFDSSFLSEIDSPMIDFHIMYPLLFHLSPAIPVVIQPPSVHVLADKVKVSVARGQRANWPMWTLNSF